MEIANFPIFKIFSNEEILQIQNELNVYKKAYKKDECVFSHGDTLHNLYFLQQGKLAISHENSAGDAGLISYIHEGECFAESYALLQAPLRVSITALMDSEVVCFQIPLGVSQSLPLQKLMIEITKMLAQKNILMNERMHIVTYKKMRSRLLAYFHILANKQSSTTIDLPYRRQALADYLCLDRSALSREVSAMEKDGLISINKQTITLLKKAMK